MLRCQPGHFLLQPLDLLSLGTHMHKDHEIHITNVYHQTQKCFEKETITRAKMVAQNKQSSEKMAALFCHNEKRRCVCVCVCVCVSGSPALLSSHLLSVICSWASSAGIKCRLQIKDVCVIKTHKTDTYTLTQSPVSNNAATVSIKNAASFLWKSWALRVWKCVICGQTGLCRGLILTSDMKVFQKAKLSSCAVE